jgi:hypothetical protein
MAPRDEERPGGGPSETPARPGSSKTNGRGDGGQAGGGGASKDVPRGVTFAAGDERGAGDGHMPRSAPRIPEPRPGPADDAPPAYGDASNEPTDYGRAGGGHQATAAGARWVWWPAFVVLIAALIYLLSRLGAPS